MTEKRCFACTKTKPVSEFYRSNVTYYQKECKTCNRERKYKWHKSDQGKRSSANTKLKARFGITIDQYESMVAAVGGRCEICGAADGESYVGHKLCVDHCHETGTIRGILCKACNLGISAFKDKPELLRSAIAYLSRLRTAEKVKGVASQ